MVFCGVKREKACGMVARPPPSATCRAAPLWQLSQPVRSGGSLPEAMLLKCGFLKKLNHISAWQVRHTSLPTKPKEDSGACANMHVTQKRTMMSRDIIRIILNTNAYYARNQ